LCAADAVEGFSVFKGLANTKSRVEPGKVETGKVEEDSEVVRRRKEIEREIEVMSVLQCTVLIMFTVNFVE
jgi:hypothetical protein